MKEAIPVDISVIFRAGADPTPYKIRVNGRAIKVDRVISHRRENIAGTPTILYHCQSSHRDRLVRYDLRFVISDGRWLLMRPN